MGCRRPSACLPPDVLLCCHLVCYCLPIYAQGVRLLFVCAAARLVFFVVSPLSTNNLSDRYSIRVACFLVTQIGALGVWARVPFVLAED